MPSLPRTTAALLHSARYALPANLLLTAYLLWRGGGWAAAGAVLLAAISVLQVRMAFDAALLRGWAEGASTPQDFDRAMQTLGLRGKGGRPMAERCRGALRLFRQWLAASAVQAGVAVLAAFC